MIYQRIVALANVADGESNDQGVERDNLVEKVKNITPKTALTNQDRIQQMKKRREESWSEFLDRYSLYAHSCTRVSDQKKIAEL